MAQVHTTFTELVHASRDESGEDGTVYNLDGSSGSQLRVIGGSVFTVGNLFTFLFTGANANQGYGRWEAAGKTVTFISAVPTQNTHCTAISQYLTINAERFIVGVFKKGINNISLQSSGLKPKNLDLRIKQEAGGSSSMYLAKLGYNNITVDLTDNAGNFALFSGTGVGGAVSTNMRFVAWGSDTVFVVVRGGGYGNNNYLELIDPVFDGVTGNKPLMQQNINGYNGGNRTPSSVYYSIDVTAIRHDDAKIRVVDEDGDVLHDDVSITQGNTTLHDKRFNDLATYSEASTYSVNEKVQHEGLAYNCTTAITTGEVFNVTKWERFTDYELAGFAEKNVLLCKVKEIETTASRDTKTISYTIRRLGYQDITVSDLDMHAPVVIESHLIDNNWGNTGTTTEISTAQELYDEVRKYNYANLARNVSVSLSGNTVNFTQNVRLSDTASNLISVSNGTLIIKASNYTEGLKTSGTVEGKGFSSGAITDSTGVRASFSGFPTNTGLAIAVIEKLDTSNQALNPRVFVDLTADEGTGIGSATLEADTKYRYKSDALGYKRSNNDEWTYFDTSDTSSIEVSLERINDSSGTQVYGNANATRLALIHFDASTMGVQFEFSTGNETFSFSDAFDFLDKELTSHAAIKAGLRQASFDVSRNEIIFPNDTLLRLSDRTGNTGRVFLDFVVRKESDSTPRGMLASEFNTNYGLEIAHSILTADQTQENFNELVSNNSTVSQILEDTNELQGNQGDWATATGFSTQSSVDALETKAQADTRQGATITAIDNLNDTSAQDVYNYFTSSNREDSFKSSVPTAAQNATAVRSELNEELGRIDTAISTRSSHDAPDLSGLASQASVGALETKEQADMRQAATIAAINGLNNITAQAVYDYFTDSNRADAFKATGGTSPQDIYAYFTAGSREDVFKSSPPSASQNALAVRQEISTELAHIDEDISSRSAQSSVDTVSNNINNLNNITAQQVYDYFTNGDREDAFKATGLITAEAIYNYFTTSDRENAFKTPEITQQQVADAMNISPSSSTHSSDSVRGLLSETVENTQPAN